MARVGRGRPSQPRVLRPLAGTAGVTGSGAFSVGVATVAAAATETFTATAAFNEFVPALAGTGVFATAVTGNAAFTASVASIAGVGAVPRVGGGGFAVGVGERPIAMPWKGRIIDPEREPAIALVLAEEDDDFVLLLALTSRVS